MELESIVDSCDHTNNSLDNRCALSSAAFIVPSTHSFKKVGKDGQSCAAVRSIVRGRSDGMWVLLEGIR